jgi:hypothetical protein
LAVAGIQWCSKRWHEARILHLHLTKFNAEQLAAALSVGPPSAQLRKLKELHFYCKPDSDRCITMLTWLLSGISGLEVLSCRTFPKLFYFPPLVALKHLLLGCHDLTGLAKLLRGLPLLETLSVKGVLEEEDGANDEDSGPAHLPVLDLCSNTRLTHVFLYDVTVGRLSAARSCQISLRVLDEASLEQYDLAQVAPNLHALSWWAHEPVGCRALQRLQLCTALSVLDLRVSYAGIGRAAKPVRLSGALARLQQCSLYTAHDMHVAVPALVQWQFFKAWSRGSLHIAFEDVRHFARTVETIALSSKNLCTSGTRQILCSALSMAGKTWDDSRGDYGGTFDGYSVVSLPGVGPPLERDLSNVLRHVVCKCGACLKCLVRRGVLSPLSEYCLALTHHPAVW